MAFWQGHNYENKENQIVKSLKEEGKRETERLSQWNYSQWNNIEHMIPYNCQNLQKVFCSVSVILVLEPYSAVFGVYSGGDLSIICDAGDWNLIGHV